MLSAKTLDGLGDIRGAMYDFELVGDVLDRHVHDEDSVHITIVARGKLKAWSDDWSLEASAGQMLDFRAGEPHELMALENNTRIFNIVKKAPTGVPVHFPQGATMSNDDFVIGGQGQTTPPPNGDIIPDKQLTNYQNFFYTHSRADRKAAARAYMAATGDDAIVFGDTEDEKLFFAWAEQNYTFNPPYDPNKKY